MTSPEGTVWRFDTGALFLEFMLLGGPGRIARFDSLHDTTDLARWIRDSRIGVELTPITMAQDDIATARSLRDALWRLTWHSLSGDDADPADVSTVNQCAAGAPLVPQFGPELQSKWLPPVSASAVLSTVARDAIDVLTGPTATRIRECEADDCQLVFLDTSRPGSRRWCSMERCGNRHKVRALRSRRSTAVSCNSLNNHTTG